MAVVVEMAMKNMAQEMEHRRPSVWVNLVNFVLAVVVEFSLFLHW